MVHKLRDLFERSVRARWVILVTAAVAAVILVVAATPLWTGDDSASASERPTDTPVGTATDTPIPPTATDTPIPPTATDTPIPPTATDTPTNTPTNTPTPLQKPLSQSDFALLNLATSDKVWCGVDNSVSEPWELHVTVTPGTTAGSLKITFRDLDSVTFFIPASESLSVSHTLGGGGTDVDNMVKVEILGGDSGTGAAMVSALARPESPDPFSGDSETDNYCLTGQSASTGDAGVVSANSQIPY
ncbi:MAG: hypothetical protein IH865_04700 [Chloroflexi bacterium]|nr:hypothetical protein [Chloroflexota bacterium]